MRERKPHQEVKDVLRLTMDFEGEVLPLIADAPTNGSNRTRLTSIFLGVAHEHWLSLRRLMGDGFNHSGIALLRLQFETTLKAFWLQFSATENWIEKAGVIREVNGHLVEPELPSTGGMLKDVERTAPARAHALLDQFKTVAWRELNSYVHGGVHALANLGGEIPSAFLVQIVTNANGVWGLAATLAASLSTDPTRAMAVINAQFAHPGCLPPFTSMPAAMARQPEGPVTR